MHARESGSGAGNSAAKVHRVRALNNATSKHAMSANTSGFPRSLIVRGTSSSTLCTWNTNIKKARKWSKMSAKKYHHKPMLGAKSSMRCKAGGTSTSWTRHVYLAAHAAPV